MSKLTPQEKEQAAKALREYELSDQVFYKHGWTERLEKFQSELAKVGLAILPGISRGNNGWKANFELVKAIADEVNCMEDNNISLEEVDDVITELVDRGFAHFAAIQPINEKEV